MAALVALFGPKRGVRLDLADDVVIGRSSTATLQLIDGKVSREHCRLRAGAGKVVVEDLGSHNGTFVNGERIAGSRALAAGDELAIGDSLFLVDPDLAVMAARFGDATLAVSTGACATPTVLSRELPHAEGPDSGVPAGVAAGDGIGPLAATLARAIGAAAGAAAVVAAIQARLGPARVFVLLGDAGARGVRVLYGASPSPPAASRGSAVGVPGGRSSRTATPSSPEPMPIVARATLAEAAKRRRPIATVGPVEERSRGGTRSATSAVARAVLVAPILVGHEVRGFLHVDRDAGRGFTPHEVATLDACAAMVALHGLGGVLAPASTTPSPSPSPTGAAAATPDDDLIGESRAFARVRKLAAAAGRVTSTVLITGESGTGKEVVARVIHQASGRGAFVAVNCGAIPESLAETELFGHEKGAFTGAVAAREGRVEAADGGTLFLDEVGELALSLQVKLLRVLQERVFHRVGSAVPRSVDLRIIAATHRNLEREIEAQRFREDLFYRLNVVRIEIPPLRERSDDIPPLAGALLARIARGLGRPSPGFDAGALGVLGRAAWPGNARQLGNVIERALVLREDDVRGPLVADEIIEAMGGVDLPSPTQPTSGTGLPDQPVGPAPVTLPDKVATLERAEIEAALRAARGVKARAARALGISRPTLDKKITDLGIDLWAGAAGARLGRPEDTP